MQSFATEQELTVAATADGRLPETLGYSDWMQWDAFELDGFFGIPDYVLALGKQDASGRVMVRTTAFEMKLTNWKRALTQAYRYNAFVQCSYVVMDDAHVKRALRSIELFSRANVGLISVIFDGPVRVHLRPRVRSPYAPALRKRFVELAQGCLFDES